MEQPQPKQQQQLRNTRTGIYVEGLPKDELNESAKNQQAGKTMMLRDDKSDMSSLLSKDWRSAVECDDDDDDDTQSSTEEQSAAALLLFQAKWDALERQLEARRAHLDLIATGKSPAFVRQLRQRENEVALLKREELLEELLDNDDNDGALEFDFKGVESSSTYHMTKPSCFQRIYNAFIFELHSTLPASLSLALHCIAMVCILEGIGEVVRCLLAWVRNKHASSKSEWAIETAFYSVIFAIGIALMRCTGYLYWWLSDQDYECLKFDYHNRIRLRYPGARIMQVVRRSPIWRVTLFMVGYFLAYITLQALLMSLYSPCGQQAHLTRFLPSKAFSIDLFQTAKEAEHEDHIASQFLCDRTCQQEIDRREAGYSEMQRAEREYTNRVLTKDSYFLYWGQWAQSWGNEDYGIDESVPLYNHVGELGFATASLLVSYFLGVKLAALLPA